MLKVLVRTTAQIQAIFGANLRLLDDLCPMSAKQFSCQCVKRNHLVTLFYHWIYLVTFNKLCMCKLGTIVDFVMMVTRANEEFCGYYGGVRNSDNEVLIKLT